MFFVFGFEYYLLLFQFKISRLIRGGGGRGVPMHERKKCMSEKLTFFFSLIKNVFDYYTRNYALQGPVS